MINTPKNKNYILSNNSLIRCKKEWENKYNHLNLDNKDFFIPYRKGIYNYQIYILLEMGVNKYHSFLDIIKQLKVYLETIKSTKKRFINFWEEFINKESLSTISCKDFSGRLKDNYLLLQRLGGNTPYGYKLYQVKAAIDLKVRDRIGFANGEYFYRLSIYKDQEDVIPIRDFSEYSGKMGESSKFLGKIIKK